MKTSQKLIDLVASNIQSRGRNQRSISELMLETIQENGPQTRLELVANITQKRYQDQYKDVTDEMFDEMLDDTNPDNAETIDEVGQITKTVKNGVDTAISKSYNNSSFWFNPSFGDQGKGRYELFLNKNGRYDIEDKEAAEKPVKQAKAHK